MGQLLGVGQALLPDIDQLPRDVVGHSLNSFLLTSVKADGYSSQCKTLGRCQQEGSLLKACLGAPPENCSNF